MKSIVRIYLQSALVLGVGCTPVMAQFGGGPFNGLRDYAKTVTIGIDTPGSGGSGVIVGKDGNKYYFLTAAHVAASGSPTKEEFWAHSLSSSNDKKYRIARLWQPKEFAGKDLAIGSFETSDKLEIALVFPVDIEEFVPLPPKLPTDTWSIAGSMNGREYDKDWDIQGPPIVAGVSLPTGAVQVPLFRVSEANMQSRANGNQNGYEAIYAATSTVPGMSGGGVFAARLCPQFMHNGRNVWGAYPGLIAIHGMSESYKESQGRSGVSLGVPLDLVAKYLGKNAKTLGIPIGRAYYDKMIELCINKGMF